MKVSNHREEEKIEELHTPKREDNKTEFLWLITKQKKKRKIPLGNEQSNTPREAYKNNWQIEADSCLVLIETSALWNCQRRAKSIGKR
jgi:hypothetical protein